MQRYFAGMQNFLEVETEVMQAFLQRSGASTPTAPATPQSFPLLGTVETMVAGQELKARRTLSLEEDTFLLDHAVGKPVSLTDEHLRSMMVVPLTMSMEILAEAAVALMPGHVLSGMRDVNAYHWIHVDDTPVQLAISARRGSANSPEVAVEVRNATDSKLLGKRAAT